MLEKVVSDIMGSLVLVDDPNDITSLQFNYEQLYIAKRQLEWLLRLPYNKEDKPMIESSIYKCKELVCSKIVEKSRCVQNLKQVYEYKGERYDFDELFYSYHVVYAQLREVTYQNGRRLLGIVILPLEELESLNIISKHNI